MQRTIYFPDNAITEGVMARANFLKKEYRVSFSEVVFQALQEFVQIKRPKVVKKDFRNAKLANLR